MVGSFFTKVVGLAALGIAGYDTVATTKQLAPKYARQLRVEQLNDMYMRTSASDSPSVLDGKFGKSIRRWSLDNNLFAFKQKVVSNVVCFSRQVADNCITFGLGALALLAGTGRFSPIKIPVIGKAAAILLALKGGYTVLKGVFGIGEPDYRKNVL